MVEYLSRGGLLYNFENEDPDISLWGIVGRASSWSQAMIAAEELMKAPPEGMRLRIWRNPALSDFSWCVKWVPKEEHDADTTVVLGLDRP